MKCSCPATGHSRNGLPELTSCSSRTQSCTSLSQVVQCFLTSCKDFHSVSHPRKHTCLFTEYEINNFVSIGSEPLHVSSQCTLPCRMALNYCFNLITWCMCRLSSLLR